jgi:hypothetical protein
VRVLESTTAVARRRRRVRLLELGLVGELGLLSIVSLLSALSLHLVERLLLLLLLLLKAGKGRRSGGGNARSRRRRGNCRREARRKSFPVRRVDDGEDNALPARSVREVARTHTTRFESGGTGDGARGVGGATGAGETRVAGKREGNVSRTRRSVGIEDEL